MRSRNTSALMFDLLAVAYQADITRVFTFMMARDLHNRTYPQIGVDEPHHGLSHHQNKAGQDRALRQGSTPTTSACSASSSRSCKATPDGDGSLLDHSVILYGSGMGNANVHSHVALPYLVAGTGAGHDQGRPAHQGAHARPEREPAAQHRRQVRHRRDRVGLSTGRVDL